MSNVRRAATVLDVPGLDVERKELRRHPALLHSLDVGAIRHWWQTTEIEIVVGHWRRHVVVRVDDDGAAMDLQRALPQSFVPRLRRLGCNRRTGQ